MKLVALAFNLAVWLAAMCYLLDWVTVSFARYDWPRYLAQCVVIVDTVMVFVITTLIIWNLIERKHHA